MSIYSYNRLNSINEFFGFNKKKNQKHNKSYSDQKLSKVVEYVKEKNYGEEIKKIIEDEYNNNKKKYDKLMHDVCSKAIEKLNKEDGYNYSDDEYGEFEIDFDSSVDTIRFKKDGTVSFCGSFFNVDQFVGFYIEDELERTFFSAIEPKIKKLCGDDFYKIVGDLDDYPGGIEVLLKINPNKLK